MPCWNTASVQQMVKNQVSTCAHVKLRALAIWVSTKDNQQTGQQQQHCVNSCAGARPDQLAGSFLVLFLPRQMVLQIASELVLLHRCS